ncbi:hypothetical protein HDU99_010749 [Rhizoclosmatium hyalinum]|nr:hypothetical protein HDU99_010749 [Rhizoclosmatium hyalinum]
MGDPGFIVHGVSAFTVYLITFRPFIQYYGSVFIMYELSTPFLNIHWVCDKLGMTGGTLQLVNGIILLIVFFLARIVFGLYSSFWLFVEMYHQYEMIPLYLVIMISVINAILNSLNIFWFYKMIDSVRRRFQPGGRYEKTESGSSGIASRPVTHLQKGEPKDE